MPLFIALGLSTTIMLIFIGLAMPRTRDPVQERLNQFGSRVRTLEEIELASPFAERTVKPILQNMARFVLRFAPQTNLKNTQHNLDLAGSPNGWTASDFIGLRGLAALASGGIPLGLLLLGRAPLQNTLFLTLAGAVLGFFLPVIWLGQKIKARQKAIQKGLPDALDLLTISVEAGLALDAGFAKVAEQSDSEISRAFGRVITEVRVGRPRKDALRDMADRSGVPDLTAFVTALIQAEQLGVSMTKILRIQSEQMRIKRRQRAEEEAHKAPVKMSVVLVLMLLPGIFIVILGPAVPRLCRQFDFSDLCK
ncbi:MAG: type II secretion system F family protein [Chloroflexi bacterium]|nr:MAG: type II secretion system F family protein [Chloroflexota bacterium]